MEEISDIDKYDEIFNKEEEPEDEEIENYYQNDYRNIYFRIVAKLSKLFIKRIFPQE
jgi:hypothetical protein